MPKVIMIGLDMSQIADNIKNLVNNGLEFIEKGFGVTAESMFIQLLATLLLFLAVRFLFWNKITDILEKRKAMIDDSFKARDEALATSVKLNEESSKLKQDARKEANDIIENAKRRSIIESEKILSNAQDEANNRLKAAEEEISLLKTKAEDDIKKEIVDVAYLMAEKIVEKEVNHKKYDKTLNESLDKVNTSNGK